MALVQDLLDGLRRKQSDRSPWEQHWLEISRYALPDAERFDALFTTGSTGAGTSAPLTAVDSVVSEPVASRRSKDIYDQTSLWAIDRGANGTLSLVTPQSGTWHDLANDEPFAPDPTDQEDLFNQSLRDYLFSTRGNPRSGFWQAHKAAVRSMWAFGTGVSFLEESRRGVSSPISYCYVPISENHLGCNFEGIVDENYRLFRRSARQCVERWGSKCSAKTQKMADDPKERDKAILILHAVYPRDEKGSYGNTNRSSPWSSCYVEVDEKHLIGESGYWEFPFTIYHWQRNNPGPYAEGPMALALAEVKSLNMLAKTELRAAQMWADPPFISHSTEQRLNLNSRAPNPGFMDANGRALVQPLITQQRPDFAHTIIEARREQLRQTLYIDLWQSIINAPREMTAFEAMIRNQEKGDLLGPVGSSLQAGLSLMVDREIGILARKGAFEDGSPLAPPDTLRGKSIGVRFTSPLDKLRRLPQLQGMTQLATAAAQVAAFKPDILDKIDWDAYIDEMQDILDAPQKIMTPDDVLANARQQRAMAANAQTAIAMTGGAGQAAEAAASGVEAIASSPASSDVLRRLAGVAGVPA